MPIFNICLMCGQGSDIETLGLEPAVEYGAELLECSPVEEAKPQESASASASAGKIIIIIINVLFMACV